MDDLKKLADALASPRRWHELTDDECDAAAAVLRSVAAAQLVPEGGHVAWCRYKTSHTGRAPTSIILCDSDAEGAFKVYRAAPPPPAAQQAAEPVEDDLRENADRWQWLVRHASLGFDGAPSWNAVVRLPVFDHDDQTITALVDRARSADQARKGG